jgi:hypothetical protein
MDFWDRVCTVFIIFSLIAVLKFLSEITSSITSLNNSIAMVVEKVEMNESRINKIETFIFE